MHTPSSSSIRGGHEGWVGQAKQESLQELWINLAGEGIISQVHKGEVMRTDFAEFQNQT